MLQPPKKRLDYSCHAKFYPFNCVAITHNLLGRAAKFSFCSTPYVCHLLNLDANLSKTFTGKITGTKIYVIKTYH